MSRVFPTHSFLISRGDENGAYRLWSFDPDAERLLSPVKTNDGARLDPTVELIQIGGYVLKWGAMQPAQGGPYYDYQLIEFDPTSGDPLNAPPLQHGSWDRKKFWGRGADFGNPTGGHMAFERDTRLRLIPLGSFVLNFIPTSGRGTFALWNFDPCPIEPGQKDPLPGSFPYTPQGSFRSIEEGHELIPMNGYVLDREVATGRFAVWSFDPREKIPLMHPTVQEGRWSDVDASHELVAIDEYVLDWVPADRSFRLFRFDPKAANPLGAALQTGTLPEEFTSTTTLTGLTTRVPIDATRAARPGTIDFMRKRVKKVVYYMLENRSFDHACGWLYEHGAEGVQIIGRPGPFQGASTEYYNLQETDEGTEKVFLSKYKGGDLSTDYSLEMFQFDPYHDNSDVMRQLFYENRRGYEEGATPDMGGFVWNNGTPEVMQTFSNDQLPVLTGLARGFGVSDEWFCSMPTDTDVNRAFSLTGSAMMQLNNFMSPPEYNYWPEEQHRPSIWKILWANGITDWKLYNSTEWMNCVFSVQLYLEGQIPTVDAEPSRFVAGIDQFMADAKSGDLPAFSFLEPVWIGKNGTTSYHPGEDVVPGERQLNDIYNALREGPDWEETLLIITFDEHGGIYDHVPPPRAEKPWPNDVKDGFHFDLLGPRVPTILVSPWIDEQVVFRSATETAFDATSFLATLLSWFGVPKSNWYLGDRTNAAPTFEAALTRTTPRCRTETPDLTPPFDAAYPPAGAPSTPSTRVHGLHRDLLHRMVCTLTRGKLAPNEVVALSAEMNARATDVPTLNRLMEDLHRRFGRSVS